MTDTHADSAEKLIRDRVHTLGIVGLGLLGGSFALRMRECFPHLHILGLARRRESVREARQAGIIDDGSTEPGAVLPEADLTVICTPVSTIINLARHNAELWQSSAVVTDVGSVKGNIVETLTPMLNEYGVHFVGSHPMAGSEKFGLAHADAQLYNGATVLVTPSAETDSQALKLVSAMWKAVGAAPVEMPAAVHDRALARTSHLIHLLAAAAVEISLETDGAVHATGGGFRDFSRIAASSPEMWRQIFEMNREPLLEALQAYQDKLRTLEHWVQAGDWDKIEDYFTRTGKMRTDWFRAWTAARQQNQTRERYQ